MTPDPNGNAQDPTPTKGRTGLVIAIALVFGLAVGVGATLLLRDDGPSRVPAATSGTTRDGDPEAAVELPTPDEGITPDQATDPEAAIRGFLAAEASGDFEASYDYLVPEVTDLVFQTPAAWAEAHADFPRVVGYRIDDIAVDEAAGTATVRTLTGFEAVLDPVIGLVAARGRTTWTLEQQEDGRWLVDSQATENQPLYPGSEGAGDAVRAWVDARVACEDTSELESGLIGARTQAAKLCEEEQADVVELGPVGPLTDSPDVSGLLSEFGPEVFSWARTVRVEAATPFVAVLAPIGSEWRVVAALPAR